LRKNDRLDITEYTQAAMVTTSIAMTKVLEEHGVKPDVTAGLSLGEYCALYAAGVISEADAIKTVSSARHFHAGGGSGGTGRYGVPFSRWTAAAIEEVIAEHRRRSDRQLQLSGTDRNLRPHRGCEYCL